MKPATSPSSSAHQSSDLVTVKVSAQLIAELLARNEEMIVELTLERQAAVGSVVCLTALIDQHEKTAALFRALLDRDGPADSNPAPDGG